MSTQHPSPQSSRGDRAAAPASAGPTVVAGRLFAAGHGGAMPARLVCDPARGTLWLVGARAAATPGMETPGMEASGSKGSGAIAGEEAERLTPAHLLVRPPLPGVPLRVDLADGRVFEALPGPDAPALLRACRVRVPGGWRYSLETAGPWGLALLLLAFGGGLVGLRLAAPMIADGLADLCPPAIEREIGDRALATIIGRDWQPSTLDPGVRAALAADLARLCRAAGLDEGEDSGETAAVSAISAPMVPDKPESNSPPAGRPCPALVLGQGPGMGANALAVPGGPILVTDALVRLALTGGPTAGSAFASAPGASPPGPAALTGVLAHELAHVMARHGLRRMVRAAIGAGVVGLVLGDAGALIDQAAALPLLLLDRGYARAFEREADQTAAVLLARAGVDLAPFLTLLARLEAADTARAVRAGPAGAGGGGSWLDTHPAPAERIARLRRLAAAQGAPRGAAPGPAGAARPQTP